MPTVVVLLPVVLIVCFNPLGPNDTLALFALRLSLTPGKIFMLFLNLKPIF